MGKIRAALTAVLMLLCMAYGNASELEREWDGVIYPRPQKNRVLPRRCHSPGGSDPAMPSLREPD